MKTESISPSSRGTWLKTLLEPKSVAVVGASDDMKVPGGRVLRYMLSYGFAGTIYAVNPKRATVQGVQAFPSVADLPQCPDLAMIIVPATAALEALEQCGKLGVPAAVIGSAGFAEAGANGIELQARLAAVAKQYSIRLIGPNTNGIINCKNGLALTFTPALDQEGLVLPDGPVAIVSQSGAIGAALFYDGIVSGMRIGRLLNTGNELDVSLEDALDALIDPGSGVDTILCYVEGLRHAKAFVSAAKRAQSLGKRIVLLKAGATEAGAQAAAAHTASLAGEDRVYDGVLRQLGVARAQGLTHLLDVGRVLASQHGKKIGTRASIASLSGGIGIMLTDELEKVGMRLAPFPQQVKDGIDALLPPFLARKNPLDLGGSPFHDLSRLRRILKVLDESPESDMTILAVGSFERRQIEIADAMIQQQPELSKPLYVVWYGGGADATKLLNSAGIPCCHDPKQLVQAIAAAANVARGETGTKATAASSAAPNIEAARATLKIAKARDRQVLDEVDAKRIFAAFGMDVVMERVVADASECAEATRGLRWPLVAKIRSDEIMHKARVGGVRLGLQSPADLQTAVAELFKLARRLNVKSAEVVVQEQVERGVELLLGMKHDPTFGPVITLGIGGVLTEVWDDVQVRLANCEAEVSDMLASLRHQSLLDGSTGAAPVELAVVSQAVSAFCKLVANIGDEVEAIDINPLILQPGRAIAVDGLIFPRK